MCKKLILMCLFLWIPACGESGSGAEVHDTSKVPQEEGPEVLGEGSAANTPPEIDTPLEIFTIICDYPARGQCDEYDEVIEADVSSIQQLCEEDGLAEFYGDSTCDDIRPPEALSGYCERDNPDPTSFHYVDSNQGCEKPMETCINAGDRWVVVNGCEEM